MSHHNSIQDHQPNKVQFLRVHSEEQDMLPGNIPVPLTEPELLIPGQGTLVFKIPEFNQGLEEVKLTFKTPSDDAMELVITKERGTFNYRLAGTESWAEVAAINKEPVVKARDGYTSAIDLNPECLYWVSIDSLNKRLRYGKGEMRLSTALIDVQYDRARTLFDHERPENYPFIGQLKTYTLSTVIRPVTLWKDPVVTEPPAYVVPSRNFTMDAAAKGVRTTPNSLSKECQILYGNVADFQLSTPDFPDFAQAIEYSIRTEGCLGYEIIKTKLENNAFGKHTGDYQEVYLRITLGYSQGESPGIPYVMEIWPVGCASPVHHHGYTNAIIKVLRGAIDVDIYRMLPCEHSSDKALKTVVFEKDDVTYLMPEVNQYHLLKNNLANTETCITIQCYSYSQDDDAHYAYFQYVENKKVGNFDPISDCDYVKFKETVRSEWEAYLKTKFWLKPTE